MKSGAVFPKNRVAAGLMLLWVILGTTACSGDSGKAKKSNASADLFRDGNIPTIKIEIPRAGIETLRKYRWRRGANEQERVSVAGTVKEGAEVYTNVAIHLKGAAGSFRTIDQNPGLTLNFDKWADGQRFHGLQKLSLANALQDPTFVADKLCRELYLKVGVPVPRAGHARVYLNGRDLGLHVLTEGWNKQFLHRHFKNPKGNLYDCGFAHDVTSSSMEVNSGDKDDQSDLVRLVDAAKAAAKEKKLDPLAPVLDVDRFIRLIVMDGLLWNWDGYAIGHNNYRVFHDLDSDKMIFMPHGLDQMFWRPDGPIMPEGKGLIAHAVLASREGRKRYMDYTRKFIGDFFNSAALTDRVREISASIEPALNDIGHSAVDRQHEAAEQFCRMIILRVAGVRSQLAGSSNLVTMAIGRSVLLTNWMGQAEGPAGKPADPLHLVASPDKALDFCQKTVWLEAGYYTLEGRVQTKGVKGRGGDEVAGAGFRVVSQRKPSLGVQWDWFPYRESRDYDKRGEMIPPDGRNDRVAGTSEWTPLGYDFDLKQPMADLQFFCELRGDKGEAWFDPASIRLVRRATSKLPAQKK